jgi:hypothetical protein
MDQREFHRSHDLHDTPQPNPPLVISFRLADRSHVCPVHTPVPSSGNFMAPHWEESQYVKSHVYLDDSRWLLLEWLVQLAPSPYTRMQSFHSIHPSVVLGCITVQ